MSEEAGFEGEKKTILGPGFVGRIDRTFGIAAGIMLFVLMMVVTVDVIGRYLFSAPLHGSFEYVQICMAMVVFLALPVIVARDDNVQVDVFEVMIPKALRRITRMIGFTISVAVVAGLTWITFLRAHSFYVSDERFFLLPLPLYPVAWFIFATWAVCLVIVLIQLVKYPAFLGMTERDR